MIVYRFCATATGIWNISKTKKPKIATVFETSYSSANGFTAVVITLEENVTQKFNDAMEMVHKTFFHFGQL